MSIPLIGRLMGKAGSLNRAAIPMTAASVSLLLLSGCSRGAEWRRADGAVWNTVYTITYESERDMSDSIQEVFRMVEMSLSPFNDNSLVSRVNRGETSETDTLLRRVFLLSSDICRHSGGRFDPTVSPAVNLWKFGYTGKVGADENWEPSRQEIDSVMEYVGILDCSVDEDGRIEKKHPLTTFNFSAVTKGYACDLIAEMLLRNGVENSMVEIGGEVTVRGSSPRGGLWRLQIDAPVEDEGAPTHRRLDTVDVTDCGVATSGNYRNYHQSSRGRVGHTIDPLTGEPCSSRLLSVTVIAPTCAEADAYATAAMASPGVDAADSILSVAGLRGIIVYAASDSVAPFSVRKVE